MSADPPVATTGVPFLRTMRSRSFRLLVASLLVVAGLALNVVLFMALDADGGVSLEDFEAYYDAGARLAEGEPLYTVAQLDAPIDAVCPGCYIYPPLLAQVLAPFDFVPLATAKVGWFVLLSVVAFAATWIGSSIGGARRSLERVLWTVVATAFFFPVFHSNWLGNVGSLVALGAVLVALGGTAGGIGAAFVTLLKVSPLVYVPVALVSDARSRLTVLAALVGLFALFAVLDPSAWANTPVMLANLVAGSGDVHWNLAPASMAASIGWPDVIVTGMRAVTVVAGSCSLLAAVWLARSPAGLPLGALLATVAMLLIPGTFWYHYLAVLLPFAAMAWPGSGAWFRTLMVVAAVVTSLAGMNILPIGLSFFSAVVILAVAGWALRPSKRERPELERIRA